ncbi:molybdopterin/thiamine biosynthesis adenylyltransferase [Saccharothrix saharensis]|uniref:Molybdopterin/thiamine biosynthesis adenylyltransferase n=1 Tax=Saccharothrix saharensis TaxID=571190 RepID=A0A543JNV3_9PSEU|nr:ThiF family adenylyltransferase [Saccharothrix saharensis]TQM84510.1 molybdopterin/thiamine biosynthesis adenylyltransferase [Saccharothrix saharensis]
MVRREVNPPADGWSLTLPAGLWADLSRHLFTDGAGHGAVILAEHVRGPRGPRLLGRRLILAGDGVDYVEGTTGHHALRAEFVRDAAVLARDEGLAYLAVHNHYGTTTVGFSIVDLSSHERGYPALRQITRQLVGAVVFTSQAAAGDLWLPDGTRTTLAEVVVPDNNVLRLQPRPAEPAARDPEYDRQSRLFGDRGQETLRQLHVAVVGLGGVGSVVVELLARLGVGHLVLIDADHAARTNLPRLIAARHDDVGRPKTSLAARNARQANPDVMLTLIQQEVQTPRARDALAYCDWIFLAADTDAARHWVNEAVHQHLIPATQIGVKIPVDADGTLGQIHAVTRPITPDGGCLWCNELIDATELAIDMLPDAERERARYVAGVPAPSVIALNTLAAAEAVNHFMLAVTNLHHDDTGQAAVLHRPRSRDRDLQNPRRNPLCPTCSRCRQRT